MSELETFVLTFWAKFFLDHLNILQCLGLVL